MIIIMSYHASFAVAVVKRNPAVKCDSIQLVSHRAVTVGGVSRSSTTKLLTNTRFVSCPFTSLVHLILLN